ncbi:winged helix-turn-helix transcriptional regulator [Ferroglobus placidus]|nr:winged helix-turn-helix transcriptional regulator [Ferroglobus placidus]
MEKLKKLMKPSNIKILFLLESGEKRWSELEKSLNKKQVSESLKELIDLRLVRAEERTRGLKTYKVYSLTKKGKALVKELKTILKILEDE